MFQVPTKMFTMSLRPTPEGKGCSTLPNMSGQALAGLAAALHALVHAATE